MIQASNHADDKGHPAKTPGEFDPYHKWLGIAPKDQPPHHYRLLGIDLFEADLDVIDAAAMKQIAYIRQCALGPHGELSQQLLNKLSEAQVCLLNPNQKAAYDGRLKAKLNAKSKALPAPTRADTLAKPAADAKLQQQTQNLDVLKKQIESLLEKCEFASAINSLENIASVKHPSLTKYSRWAQQQLPKAKRGPREMRESSAAMQRTAEELFERFDYEDAAELLQQIPKKYRSPEAKQLLDECLDLQDKIFVLREDIDHAEAINKYDDLMPTVKRLLELKPGDRRARRLLKELKAYGKGGNMILGHRRDQRFDAVGSTTSPLKVAMFIIISLGLFGAVSHAVVDYLRSNDSNPLRMGLNADSGIPASDSPATSDGDSSSGTTNANVVAPGTASVKPVSMTLNGHTDSVYCADFSRDGKWIVSCGRDKTVKL